MRILALAFLILAAGAASVLGAAVAGPSHDESADLDRLSAANVTIELSFEKASLAQVFGVLEKVTPVDFELKSMPERKVTIHTEKIELKSALIQLARDYDLSYEVVGKSRVVVSGKGKAGS